MRKALKFHPPLALEDVPNGGVVGEHVVRLVLPLDELETTLLSEGRVDLGGGGDKMCECRDHGCKVSHVLRTGEAPKQSSVRRTALEIL